VIQAGGADLDAVAAAGRRAGKLDGLGGDGALDGGEALGDCI